MTRYNYKAHIIKALYIVAYSVLESSVLVSGSILSPTARDETKTFDGMNRDSNPRPLSSKRVP